MARKQLVSIDFNNLASLNFKLQNAAGGIASPAAGSAYYDTSAGKPMFHNGTAFLDLTARANHTGTQLAATISNFDTQVRTSRLDQMAAPTAAVTFGNQAITNVNGLTLSSAANITLSGAGGIALSSGNIAFSGGSGGVNLSSSTGAVTLNATGGMNANGGKITNLAAPTAANDGARLIDIQSAAAGIDSKGSVRVVAITNVVIASAGLAVIDGVTLIAGDRVLLKGQTTPAENGVYVAAAGAWARAADADATGEITPGAFWFVEEGTTYAATQWRCSNIGTVTLGTTGITIVQFGAATVYTASNGVLLTGSNYTGVVEANKGLSVGASGFAILPDPNAGLQNLAAGVGIKLNTNSGLALAAAGVSVLLATNPGLQLSATGLAILTSGASSCLQTAGGLAVVANNAQGIATTASGIGISLATNPGLSFNSGLQSLNDPNGGLQNAAAGTSIKLDTNPGLQTLSTGTSIKLAGSSGLTLTAAGLAVDSAVAVKKYAGTIGDGTATTIAVTHNLGTKDITLSLREVTGDAGVDFDWVATSTTVATLTFVTAPTAASLRVVVHG